MFDKKEACSLKLGAILRMEDKQAPKYKFIHLQWF